MQDKAVNPVNGNKHWLNFGRLSLYSRLMFIFFLGLFITSIIFLENMMSGGQPFGHDFIQFWAASYLGLAGHAQDAYSTQLLLKATQVAIPTSKTVFTWSYPPSFYLMILPLALLPYMLAYSAFILSTLGGYILVLRRIVRGNTAMWCLAGFSGLGLNIIQGQNAFLTAALTGAALLNLERRPVLAGIFIGLLSIKPHLALLFPVALIAIGAWRTFITAAITALTLTAIGTTILGVSTLKAFLANFAYVRILLEGGGFPWSKMPTGFVFLRMLHMPVTGAYLIHAIVSVGAAIVVWRVWRSCQDWQLRGATLMTATFLISPYVFDYDLAWLAFPIAWLALAGLRDGWLRGEREVLVVAWMLPILVNPIAIFLGLQLGPLVLGGLLWITVRRATAGQKMRVAPPSRLRHHFASTASD